jgi:hypothetical protein
MRAEPTVFAGSVGNWDYKIVRYEILGNNRNQWYAMRNKKDSPVYIRRQYLSDDGFVADGNKCAYFPTALAAESALLLHVGIEEMS